MDSRGAMIADSARRILKALPPEVVLVAAAKGRTEEEVEAAQQAGVSHVGHNYVQEAQPMINALDNLITWHMIGHLQRNKAKIAVQLFDVIETLDSWRLAESLDRHCKAIGKVMPVLVEVNSGREPSKTGMLPEELDDFVQRLSGLENLRVKGLMTMGPRFGDPEQARSYFRATKAAFDRLAKLKFPNVNMTILSMGMSNSFRIAIEEGANSVRIGSAIFGSRAE